MRKAIRGDRADGGACLPSVLEPAVSGTFAGPRAVKRAGKARIMLMRLKVKHGPLCGARFTLTGPKGFTYARGAAGIVRASQVVGVTRIRKLKRGLYRLKIDALGVGAIRNPVPSTLTFRLK
jgi:hypothetical protein